MIREKDIEAYLVRQALKHGLLLRKCQWVGHNHCPDRLLMSPKLTVWVELKAPNKKPRAGQSREHDRLRQAGQRVEVVDSKTGVDELINNILEVNA